MNYHAYLLIISSVFSGSYAKSQLVKQAFVQRLYKYTFF